MDDDHDPSFQASQRNQPRFLVIETVIHEGYAGSGEHIFRIFKAQTVFFAVPFALFLVPFVPGGTLLCNYNCKYISWQKSRKALYGFRTVLECAGKAARPNWTSAMLCYATVAMVTDYDCWHPNHDDVTVDVIVQVLRANADNARSLVKKVAPRIRADQSAQTCGCRTALEYALITPPDGRDPELVEKLGAVAGRMLNSD